MSGWAAAWEALYLLGRSVGVFFVDNNSIGNRKKLRDDVLPAMMDWMKRRKYPFDFGTEASIDLAEYRLVRDAPLQWEKSDYVHLRHHYATDCERNPHTHPYGQEKRRLEMIPVYLFE
jgi:hypothetical protein